MEKPLDLLLPQGALLCGGRYRIEKYLSSGGFGNTYLAVDTETNGLVAIKELFVKGMCGRDADAVGVTISLTENRHAFSAHQTKFRKEAQRLQHLSNEHIVKVHRQFDENGTSYYAMDYINGESLSARLKRTGKPMTETAVMSIFLQVLSALEAMHKENLWHLDLKPGNIMLDNSGNAILIDFGASKQTVDEDGNTLSTSSQMACTPGYAAMEQTEQNMSLFGPWTDLYALGATLYNLLTLQRPPTTSEILSGAELALPENISGQLRDVITKLMQPVWDKRPQSVADVRRLLSDDTVVKGSEVETENGNKPKLKKKNNGSIITLVILVFLLVGSVVSYSIKKTGINNTSATTKIVTAKNEGVKHALNRVLSDTAEKTEQIQLTEATGVNNNHDYVDLGLSVKWATSNVGADCPEDYGGYYAWGEVSTKNDYSGSSYNYDEPPMTLQSDRDVAHVKWGSSWRMPTTEEIRELTNNCNNSWITHNGVKGVVFTSKLNGNSIFLPAGGYHNYSDFDYCGECGYYWSSSLCDSHSWDAFGLYFKSSGFSRYYGNRYFGLSVRPVCP